MKTSVFGLTLLLLTIFVTTNTALGQGTKLAIQYTASAQLKVNGTEINNKTNVDKVIGLLGEPGKKTDHPNGEISYFYENYGLVVFTKDELVKGIGINYHWDGDKKFPEQPFTGTLQLGESAIDKNSTNELIASIKSVEFICPMDIMCASKDRTAKVNCTVGFEEEKLTQVVFLIK